MFVKALRTYAAPLLRAENLSPATVIGKYSFGAACSLHSSSACGSQPSLQDVIEDDGETENIKSRIIIDKVNKHIAEGPGRVFAVIQIRGKQYRVVENDLVLIERNWAPEQNDRLNFEKVLLVAGSSFTLIGRPILPKNLVTVSGTIVHKDLTHTKLRYWTVPKERIHNLNFVREELTYIRINSIRVHPEINDESKTEYLSLK